ncbi:MAG TPA: C45 family peptidase [Caldimonas sp.]|nr:C45 family peptidase [Caldimonas sp.]
MNVRAPVLDVNGSPFERGRTQGVAFKALIPAHVESLLSVWKQQGIEDPLAYRARLLRETRFRDAIEAHAPHLMREVEGIAAGCGVERDAIYALQLLDEEWAFRRHVRAAAPMHKCSSFAVRDGDAGVTWIGQNMDLGAYTDGFQQLVHHEPLEGRPGAMMLTLAGMVALLGVNDAGLGICVNSIPQVPSDAEGLPVAFMIRRLLEASSAAEAAACCESLPHATNQHYLIADPRQIYSLEASSQGVQRVALPRADRALHTNHPLASGHRYPPGEENSVARLRSLDTRLAAGAPTLSDLRAALSSFDDPRHPVCRMRSEELGPINFTTGSMISGLRARPAAVEGQVSFGPPSERGYRSFVLSKGSG